jgi:hypothetical protein
MYRSLHTRNGSTGSLEMGTIRASQRGDSETIRVYATYRKGGGTLSY